MRPAEHLVESRIDLLALDPAGAAVVIELKRGSDRHQLLQALGYAGLIRDWPPERFVERLAQARAVPAGDAEDALTEFLDADPSEVNRHQRVVLLAEGFEPEVLATAQWLGEDHAVDIRLYRMQLAQHPEGEGRGETFLSCTCLFPARDLHEHAVRRTRRGGGGGSGRRWAGWDEALATVQNPHERAFYEAQINQNREHHVAKGMLFFRHGGARRWRVLIRPAYAYVEQQGRFPLLAGAAEPARSGGGGPRGPGAAVLPARGPGLRRLHRRGRGPARGGGLRRRRRGRGAGRRRSGGRGRGGAHRVDRPHPDRSRLTASTIRRRSAGTPGCRRVRHRAAFVRIFCTPACLLVRPACRLIGGRPFPLIHPWSQSCRTTLTRSA